MLIPLQPLSTPSGEVSYHDRLAEIQRLTEITKPYLERIDQLLQQNRASFYLVRFENGATFMWRDELRSPKVDELVDKRWWQV